MIDISAVCVSVNNNPNNNQPPLLSKKNMRFELRMRALTAKNFQFIISASAAV
jgi:hypothetical protein